MIKTPELKNWKYYLSNPDRKPACLVLMLHGCGGNADDILSFASLLQKNTGNQSFVAVAPDAFLPSVEKANGYQWFDIENNYAKTLFASPYDRLSENEKKCLQIWRTENKALKARQKH